MAVQVVSIGEALYDLIADQQGVPRERVTSWKPYAGGAPCNVATCLARLGVATAFVTALGQDAPGDALVNLCKGGCESIPSCKRAALRCRRNGAFLVMTSSIFAICRAA